MRRSVGLNNHRSEQLTELGFLKFVNLTNFILKCVNIYPLLLTPIPPKRRNPQFFLLQVSSKLGVWPNLLFLTHLMSSAETPGFLISSQVSKGQLTRAGEGRVRRAVLTILTGPLCKLSIVEFLEYTIMTWQFFKRIFISILSLLMPDCDSKYSFNIKYFVSLFALIIYIITQVHFERYWIRTPSPLYLRSSYHLGTYRFS